MSYTTAPTSTHSSSQQTLRKKRLALAVGQALLLGAMSAQAATITVTSYADANPSNTSDGLCTLREAIAAANTDAAVDSCVAGSGTDSIVFDSSLTASPTTITLGGSELSITSSMSINGAQNITIDANNISRVFNLNGANVALTGLTIQGGAANYGGGVLVNNGSSVSLTNSTVSGNSVTNGGGGILAFNGSTASLSNSTVSGNIADVTGGGINAYKLSSVVSLSNSTVSGNSAAGGGGIYASNGSVSLSYSTVAGNSATDGGGIFAYNAGSVSLTNSTVSGNSAAKFGGGVDADNNSTVSLSNSTVSGNSAAYGGGGMYASSSSRISLSNSTVSGNSGAYGGGMYANKTSSVSLSNSTVSGNSALYAGGIFAANTSRASLSNSTVSGNLASDAGGGIFSAKSSNIDLSNSIIANSTGGDCALFSSTVTADGFNIIADGSCSTSAQNVDPLLGALADNGGPTKTLLPQAGSPAIDAGNQTDCTINGITTDQRGYTRIDGKCDIGSVEVGAEPASLQFTTTTASVNENGVNITIEVTRSGGTANAVSVDYATADGTAVSTPLSSADYTAASGTLNFAVGETTKSITVAIVDDKAVEGDETFSVNLSNPVASTGSAELGTNTTDTVTIVDNDKAGGGGGGATGPLMLLFAGLLWPLRRWLRRG